MNIVVFGSSRPLPGEPDYVNAYNLGKLIAQDGGTTITGGYMGTMEAVSTGANEAGGHVIGVTCRQIETWREAKANRWVKEEISCNTLTERLEELISRCEAAIALPGGPGTLAEISLFWNLLVVQAMPPKPLILVGANWKKVFTVFKQELGIYNNPHNWEVLLFASNVNEAYALINK